MIGKDSHHEIQCWRCHCSYVLPRALYVTAKASEKIFFYCPYGHEAHFPAGETMEDKLRHERDRLKQQTSQLQDEIDLRDNAILRINKTLFEERQAAVKVTKRISRGVCPCCNRTFAHMQRHMKSKHPEYIAEAA